MAEDQLTEASDFRRQVEHLSGADSIEKVDALNALSAKLLFAGEAGSMVEFSEEAGQIARRLSYTAGEAYHLFYMGTAYWLTTRLEQALATLLEADATFREFDDPSGSAKARFMIGAVYRSLGDYDQAFLEGLEPVEYFEAHHDAVWEARARLSLAMTCHEIGDFESALKHNERILLLRQDSDEQWIVGRALAGIGAAHDRMGEHREALRYHLRSLKICESAGYRMGEAKALHELGHSHQRLGDREKALEFYSRSLVIREEIDHREAQCTSLISLGQLCVEEDSEKALSFLRRALDVAEEVGAKPRIYQAHLALSYAYEVRGEVTTALEHYKTFHRVRAEVAAFTSKMRTKNLKTLFEVEKKEREAEIARLKESLEEGVSLGSYRLIEKLGSGGMGEVWLGQHRLLARPAAVKVIRRRDGDAPANEELVERFRREAEVTSSLRSPHTVQLFDFGISDSGSFHYVMELLDGMDVRQMVERLGPLEPERLIWLLRQACRSLAEAHENGLVHRDIKPANLFVAHLGGEFDFLKVLDFGTVKTAPGEDDAQLTIQGNLVGTPAFTAPEWVTGEGPMDGRADLYSLGCTAFWALTGMPVFAAKTPTATLMEHVRSSPPRVSQRSEYRIPEALENTIMQCLEKHPESRPASAMELWKQLGEIECGSTWDQDRARKWWLKHVPEMVSRRRRQ